MLFSVFPESALARFRRQVSDSARLSTNGKRKKEFQRGQTFEGNTFQKRLGACSKKSLNSQEVWMTAPGKHGPWKTWHSPFQLHGPNFRVRWIVKALALSPIVLLKRTNSFAEFQRIRQGFLKMRC